MNLHEYQAKEILSGFGVRIQRGYVASTPENAILVANKLNEETGSDFFVVKFYVISITKYIDRFLKILDI